MLSDCVDCSLVWECLHKSVNEVFGSGVCVCVDGMFGCLLSCVILFMLDFSLVLFVCVCPLSFFNFFVFLDFVIYFIVLYSVL